MLLSASALVLLVLVIMRSGWQFTLASFAGARVEWVVSALLLGLAVEVLKALRWQALLPAGGRPFLSLFSLLLNSRVLNMVAPLRAGDVWRVASTSRGKRSGLVSAGSSVVLEKVFDGAILGTVGGMLVWSRSPIGFSPGEARPEHIALVAALVAAAALAFRSPRARAIFLASPIAHLASARTVAWVACLSAAGLGVGLGVNLAVLQALGLPAEITAGAAMLVSAYAVGLVPSVPGQIGVFELAVSGALMAVGWPSGSAVTAAIGLHLVLLALLALGGLLSLALNVALRPRDGAGKPPAPGMPPLPAPLSPGPPADPAKSTGLIAVCRRSEGFFVRNGSATFLVALLALTALRGIVYAVLNPPFGSPDETSHFEYVAYLATGGAAGPRGAEGHQPVAYYALVAPAYWLAAGHSVTTQLFAIRLASIPFLLGQLVFVWLAARKISPRDAVMPIVAVAFVALLPQNTVIAASANNDNVANLVASLLTYVIVSFVLGAPRWLVPAAVAAMGLAVLSKGQLLPMAALTGLVAFGHMVRQALSRASVRPLLWLLIVPLAALPFAAREGAMLIQRSEWVLGTFGRWEAATTAMNQWGTTPYEYQFASFWAAFLGESVRPPGAWYAVPTSVVAIAGIGYILHAWTLVLSQRRVSWRHLATRTLLVAIILVQWVLVHLIFLQHATLPDFPWKLQYMQGRYLFPFLPAAALLVGEGWQLLVRRLKLPASFACGAIAALAAFDVVALSSLLLYYAWP